MQTIVLGSYGRGNIGDDAFLECFSKRFPHPFAVNAYDKNLIPASIKTRKDVKIFSSILSQDFFEKIKLFIFAKQLIYLGGDLWVRLYASPIPQVSLLKMLSINLFAYIFRKKVYYIGCGAGNLAGFDLQLAKATVALATNVYFREPKSYKLLGADFPEKCAVVTDITSLLWDSTPSKDFQSKKIGISILYDIPEPEKNFEHLIQQLVNLIDNDKRFIDYTFTLVPFQINGTIHDDLYCVKHLKDLVQSKERVSIVTPNSINELKEVLVDLDFMVGTRLHSNILSFMAGTIPLGIAYRPKVTRFFQEAQIEENVFALDDVKLLADQMHKLAQDYNMSKAQILAKRNNYIAKSSIYEKIFKELQKNTI